MAAWVKPTRARASTQITRLSGKATRMASSSTLLRSPHTRRRCLVRDVQGCRQCRIKSNQFRRKLPRSSKHCWTEVYPWDFCECANAVKLFKSHLLKNASYEGYHTDWCIYIERRQSRRYMLSIHGRALFSRLLERENHVTISKMGNAVLSQMCVGHTHRTNISMGTWV